MSIYTNITAHLYDDEPDKPLQMAVGPCPVGTAGCVVLALTGHGQHVDLFMPTTALRQLEQTIRHHLESEGITTP